jgi:hypothetical protein
MTQKLPLSDFRAVRHKLESHEFAIREGMDVAPTDLIDQETWSNITHLPDDVAIRASDHNGARLSLLHSLWGDWVEATGDPERPDELFNCMLDAGDALQCTNFLLLHGYYRAAMAELRVALELVMIGAYGNLKPDDPDYVVWKDSGSELGFTRFRRRMRGILSGDQCKWLLADDEFPAKAFRQLCSFMHSRPDSSDGTLWRSNGRVYVHEAMMLTFFTTLSVYAICYLLVRIARVEPCASSPRTMFLDYPMYLHHPRAELVHHSLLHVAFRRFITLPHAEKHHEHASNSAVGSNDDIALHACLPLTHPNEELGIALTLRRREIPFIAVAYKCPRLRIGQTLPPPERQFGKAGLDAVALARQLQHVAQDFHGLAGARQWARDEGEMGGRLAVGRDQATQCAATLRRLQAANVIEGNVELAL